MTFTMSGSVSNDLQFDRALEFVLKREGGWYDGSKPHDPNPTMKGITLTNYRKWKGDSSLTPDHLKSISDAEVREFYQELYWKPVLTHANSFAQALVFFDTAVNFGVQQAQEWIGLTTDPNCYLIVREATYRWMTRSKSSRLYPNRKGWLNRVKALRAELNLPQTPPFSVEA